MADPANLLARLVRDGHWTIEETCAAFARVAREMGEDATLSPRQLKRWMIGEVGRPRPVTQRVAEKFWGHPLPTLLGPAAVAGPASTSPIHDQLPSRGAIMDDGGTIDIEGQVAMSARRAARFASHAQASNIGPEVVAQLRDDVVWLANAYVREPLVSLIGDLVATQDTIFTALDGKQKPATARELFVLAGVVSGLMSKASHDCGRTHEAMTQARTMFVCADNAGHRGLQAWARGQQSLVAFRAGRLHDAVSYAEAGVELAEPVTGTVAAWLPALRARALAQLADRSQARQVAGAAWERRARVEPDDLDDIGGLFTFPAAKHHYYAAGAYVFLPDAQAEAEREAAAAIELYENGPAADRSFSDEAGARTELALARVRAGQVDGAREALAAVLDLPPERRIGGIIDSVRHVHTALGASMFQRSSIARDVREEIEAYSRVPASAIGV